MAISFWCMVAATLSVALSAVALVLVSRRGPSTWTLDRRVSEVQLNLAELQASLERAVKNLNKATRIENLLASQPEGVAAASVARSERKESQKGPSDTASLKVRERQKWREKVGCPPNPMDWAKWARDAGSRSK